MLGADQKGKNLPNFVLHQESGQSDHYFACYDCSAASEGALVEELASIVRGLYLKGEDLTAAVERAAEDLGEVGDPELIDLLAGLARRASIPEPGATGAPPQLDVARSELAEILAYEAAEGIFSTVIPAKRIVHKEVPGQPSRGVDLIGLDEQPYLRLVVGETKASEQEASPPAVVSSGPNSLREQLLGHLDDPQRLLSELLWCFRNCDADRQELVLRALVSFVKDSLPVVVFPVLVRSQQRYQESDFDSFKEQPGDFEPANVRFCIVRISQSVDDLAKAVYDSARGAA